MIDQTIPHNQGCECQPGETFVCVGCEKEVGYCRGGADDMPDHCDDCWAAADHDDDEPTSVYDTLEERAIDRMET